MFTTVLCLSLSLCLYLSVYYNIAIVQLRIRKDNNCSLISSSSYIILKSFVYIYNFMYIIIAFPNNLIMEKMLPMKKEQEFSASLYSVKYLNFCFC